MGTDDRRAETTVTTSGKHKSIRVPKLLALLLVVLFLGTVAATGLLVYHLSSTCPDAASQIDESARIVHDRLSSEVQTPATDAPDAPEIDVRLPRAVRPHSYKIELVPFLVEGNFTFHGRVEILLNVTETCDNVTLHADELQVDGVTVREHRRPGDGVKVKGLVNDTRRQFLTVLLDRALVKGERYVVSIEFRGMLNDLLQGFYRSSYEADGETRWIATTQFQATDARKAFPCFDEPALKAKFQISLARTRNMTSISNMRKIGDPEPVAGLPDYVWDRYEESVPMSTYLVAFVISDFERIRDGVFSVWTRHNALSQANYSLQVGPKILEFYEDFFGIEYPLPKIDMIALPDFSAGAMENWGLITYRESVLLYEEGVSSKSSLQRIAHVVAHELAHQWFGNLVTPVWWSDLWLNEGFATYVECLGANAVNPHLKELDQFLVHELHGAFMLDVLKSSHQISVKVNNPEEISDIFDRISYSKGASILRMMQHFLGMEVFRRGLNRYLNSRIYKNAEQDDLWETLTNQSHEDKALSENVTIKEIMDTWTLQTGFPVIKADRSYAEGAVVFTQERFLSFSDPADAKESVLWWVPLTYTDPSGAVKSAWMNRQPQLKLKDVKILNEDWLLVNVNQTGYYRVNYDGKNWGLITTQLHKEGGHLAFDPKNRAQILDDALNLASSGYLEYDVALNVTRYLIQEREYVPWKSALTALDYLCEMFIRTAHFNKFKDYMLFLMDDFYKEIGFKEKETDPQLLIYNRYEIYSRACKFGVKDCVTNSVQEYEAWMNTSNPDKYNTISENLREIVYCAAISVGGQEQWDFAWKRYLNANVGNEKEILLMALGCSREIWILSRYLEWAVTENSGIRKHDSARVFAAVASNSVGQDLAYRFLKTNFDRIKSYLGSASMMLSSIVRSCTIKFNSELEVEDFRNFVKNRHNEFGIALRTAQQSIEQGETNVKWMSRNFDSIVRWLVATQS